MYSAVCSTSTFIPELSLLKQTSFPVPLRLVSTSRMTKHDRTSKLVVDAQAIRSSGVIFDMMSSPILQPSTVVPKVSEKDMNEFNQMKLLFSISSPAFLEKKNRRKMVVRPTSCEMFWENEGCDGHLASTPTMATTSGTELTTPASIFTQSSTPFRPDVTPGDQVVNRRITLDGKQCARPNILRFSSLPHTELPKKPAGTINENISLAGGTRPSNKSMGKRTTVGEAELGAWDKFEIPGPNETVRFGNALTRALMLHLSQMCDIGHDEAESISYWSLSE